MDRSSSAEALQQLVLNEYPFPIAYNYHLLLSEENEKQRAEMGLRVFEYLLRSLCLALISQYLMIDHEQLTDADLNGLLRKQLARPSLGQWVNIFFSVLRLYQAHPECQLFMPELLQLYYDSENQRPRKGIHAPYERLVQIRNELAHGRSPRFDDRAAWEQIAEEVHGHLLQLFQQLSFLSDYELVHIREMQESTCLFEQYRGMSITARTEEITPASRLCPGWFYLAGQAEGQRRFLKLYPFFVSVADDTLPDIPGVQQDVGLLENYTRQQVTYYATVLWKIIARRDEAELATFLYEVDRALEEKQRKARTLSWDVLQDTCSKITALRMGNAWEKYDPAVYLQRDSLQRLVTDFLQSSKTCLVITGTSGVGKSSFLLATARHYQRNPQICPLLYSGNRWPGEQSVTEIIQTDFGKLIDLELGRFSREEDLWKRLADMPEWEHGYLLLMIDAVNENPEAIKVLHQINFLVDSNVYPWLKIILTARPEAWQTISRHVPLASQKYYWPTNEASRLSLLEDAAAQPVTIEPFLPGELKEAYRKYQAAYFLQTQYSELSAEIRQVFRDPLLLRFIAEIYAGQDVDHLGEIPKTLQVPQVYAAYLDALIKSKRLQREDIAFLEQEILPRMVDRRENALREEDFQENRTFYEQIFNKDLLQSGRPINASFANLVDANILAAIAETGPGVVAFQYERFFDYFIGKYLVKKYEHSPQKHEQYLQHIRQLPIYPFFWGGIKNALLAELRQGEKDLVLSLSQDENQAVRELVISVLTDFWSEPDGRTWVEEQVRQMLALSPEHVGLWKRVQQNVRIKFDRQYSARFRSMAKVALELSRRIGRYDLLEQAVRSPDPVICVTATRNIYYLWRVDRQKGYELLDRLAHQVTNVLGIPHIPTLEACLGISILMMRHYTADTREGQQVGEHLLVIWRNVLRKLLWVGKKEIASRYAIQPVLRSTILNILIGFVVRMQESYPADRPSFLREVGDLFQASPAVKKRFACLVDYLEHPTGMDAIRAVLRQAVVDNDTLTNAFIWLLLILEFLERRESDYHIFEELAVLDLQKPKVGMTSPNMVIALGMIGLMKQDYSDDLYRTQERILCQYLETSKGIYWSKKGVRHPNTAMIPPAILRRLRQNPADPDWLAHFLKEALQQEDWSFVQLLVRGTVAQANALEEPLMAEMTLRSLAGLFPIQNPEVYRLLVDALAQIRIYFPEVVEDFLLTVDLENQVLSNVLRVEPNEQPWSEIFQNNGSTVLLRLLQTPRLKQELIWVLRQATDQKTVRGYLRVVLKRILNLIAGDQVV